MELITLQVGILQSNCYILINENNDCIIVDCGGDFDKIYQAISQRGAKLKGVLLTHGHADHIMGASQAQQFAPVYIHRDELDILSDDTLNLCGDFGLNLKEIKNVIPLDDGKYEIGGFTVEVIKTSGHTKGSCCYYIGGKLFSGDTIFFGSYGRTDLKSGDFSAIKKSVGDILSRFDGDTEIFPGHGISTTVKMERKINPLSEYAEN